MSSGFLSKLFRWVFTVGVGISALAAVAITTLLLADPKLPAGAHFGPATFDFGGQPGTVLLRPAGGDANFTVDALKGSVIVSVEKAGGFLDVLKHYGLPVLLIKCLFFIALFEFLRRLFRNVGRGESFTAQSMHLVQAIGVSLLVYSVITAVSENWFAHAAYSYLVDHSTLTISGTTLHLPSPRNLSHSHGFLGPIFFSGLLVLALSEVFRQGLALKSENDLTV
jgi:hypothetical protein